MRRNQIILAGTGAALLLAVFALAFLLLGEPDEVSLAAGQADPPQDLAVATTLTATRSSQLPEADADLDATVIPDGTPTTSQTTEPVAPLATEPTLTGGGWINPIVGENVGHPNAPSTDGLTEFTEAGTSTGVNIDAAFLQQHNNAAWLKNENGRPVIDGLYAPNTCLNIQTTLTLRNSYINCPVRKQADPGSWGYPGSAGDTPAIMVQGDDVLIERNTITCSGFDGDICARNIWIAGANTVIRYNDLSGARGAVQLFDGAVFEYNYLHSFGYGFDPSRAGNRIGNGTLDEITHNNAVNNYGYSNATVRGNYIDARYGKVSREPNRYLNPYAFGPYEGRVVEVGDPINGFTFINYLSESRNGSGYRVLDNYVAHAGRPFACNSSSVPASPDCLAEFSNNAFEDNAFDGFGANPLLQDTQGQGRFSGSCNYLLDGGARQYLPANIFGSRFTHATNNC